MHRRKGRPKGVQNAFRFFLGIDTSALSPFNADTLIRGESELGIDWLLGPSDYFPRYAFNVEVAHKRGDGKRRPVRALVEWLQPAHTDSWIRWRRFRRSCRTTGSWAAALRGKTMDLHSEEVAPGGASGLVHRRRGGINVADAVLVHHESHRTDEGHPCAAS